ncbi:pre-mRNA-splicing factor syf1 homolog isoform 1-T1 [Glossina fuscipes fuscipes]
MNMMAGQFINSANAAVDPSSSDAMRLLDAKPAGVNEQKERQALKNQTSSNIMFVRGETQGVGYNGKMVNPDVIDIGDSDDNAGSK